MYNDRSEGIIHYMSCFVHMTVIINAHVIYNNFVNVICENTQLMSINLHLMIIMNAHNKKRDAPQFSAG